MADRLVAEGMFAGPSNKLEGAMTINRVSHRVDVGGYRLAARTEGDMEPSIVFVSGMGWPMVTWDLVLPKLARTGSTTVYDRAGTGASDALPPELNARPRTLGQTADELRRLLEGLDAEGPHVLVGHSIGGLITLNFAARWPDQVAGLVLLDSITPQELSDIDLDPQDSEGDRGPQVDFAESYAELESAEFPAVPSIVLTRAVGDWERLVGLAEQYAPKTLKELDDEFQQSQAALAARLSALRFVANFAGHHVHVDQTDLAVACIAAVAYSTHTGQPLAIPPARLQYAGGYLATDTLGQ
jgi:pimeloyl-ACP methyl ester carboxylesterase